MIQAGLERFALSGQVAVVTGAARGLGYAAASGLAEAGADVVLIDLDGNATAAAATRIHHATGRRVLGVAGDVTDGDGLILIAQRVEAELGRVDVLVNNAGIVTTTSILETPVAEWQRVLDVNLTGALHAVKAFVPPMVRRGYGRVINVGSMLSSRGTSHRGAYAASKAGLANMTRVLASELGMNGITANTLCPAVFRTELNREQIETVARDRYATFLSRIPLGRFGEPDDLVGPLLFLASPGARYVTGQTLFVDGGYMTG